MSDKNEDKGLMDAAKESAAKAPVKPPEQLAAENKAAKEAAEAAQSSSESATQEQSVVAAEQIGTFMAEIEKLRAELAETKAAAAGAAVPAVTLESTVDHQRARIMYIAQSESQARASDVGNYPEGGRFTVPIINPITNEVQGYKEVDGTGRQIGKPKKTKD